MSLGFAPIWDENSRVLILGSFPSVRSRAIGFYYGNKQNRMWKMLGEFFGETVEEDTTSKIEFLKRHGIAMWDVVRQSELRGSADASLRISGPEEINDIGGFVEKSKIRAVLCNGKTAYSLLMNYCTMSVPAFCMPSTSPANPRYRKEDWFLRLEAVGIKSCFSGKETKSES